MTTVGSSHVTWADVAASVDPSGKTLAIVEMLDEVNEIFDDIPMKEGNTQTGHMVSVRTGIPTPTFRRINRGTPQTKATEEAVEFVSGVVEDRGEIDELLVKIQKEPEMYRIRQNRAHIQGMSQLLVDTIFYGDVEVNPDRFTGLSAFYSNLTADSSANIIDAGGSGSDNTSMWLVCWSDDSIGGFYAANAGKAGIEHQDKGLEKCFDADSNVLYKFADLFRAYMGLYVADWRQAVRIANLDVSDLATSGAESDTAANLIRLGVKAKNKIWNPSLGKCAWYCNRDVKTALDIQAINKPNAFLNVQTLKEGVSMTTLHGYPVRRVDALLNTESRVVA